MNSVRPTRAGRRRRVQLVLLAAAATSLASCAAVADGADQPAVTTSSTSSVETTNTNDPPPTDGSNTSTHAAEPAASENSGSCNFLTDHVVHTVELTFDQAAYEGMIATFADSGDKEWIEVSVTIDGAEYSQAGARLKGNSSLRSLSNDSSSSADAEALPWLIRLDKYVDDQNHEGLSEFVVRANSSESSLNEAVALDLLQAAGLASQEVAMVRLSVNGSDADLRLVIENPGDAWDDANFDGDGVLYKAESSGDYSYRGDDPAAYDDVFDQETGEEDNLTPLIEFLDFVNNSDDATFAAELSEHLDVASFAAYLATEELLDNFDDIDGPGNNSYLRWSSETDQFTVVAWDHNLAFGLRPGEAQGAEGVRAEGVAQSGPNGQVPAEFPAGERTGGGMGGPNGRSNTLVTRFLEVDEFSVLVEESKADLNAALFASGVASTSLETWQSLLSDEATDLIDPTTLADEAAHVEAYFS